MRKERWKSKKCPVEFIVNLPPMGISSLKFYPRGVIGGKLLISPWILFVRHNFKTGLDVSGGNHSDLERVLFSKWNCGLTSRGDCLHKTVPSWGNRRFTLWGGIFNSIKENLNLQHIHLIWSWSNQTSFTSVLFTKFDVERMFSVCSTNMFESFGMLFLSMWAYLE